MPSPPTEPTPEPSKARANARLGLICLGVFALMVGASFAAVPLYRIFCQRTGYAGTVRRAVAAPTRILDQRVTVSFDTNVRGLPWTFTPDQESQSIRIGDTGLAFFTVTNNADVPLTGRAAYNVAPDQAAAYFEKLRCFCFNDQTIPAHTTMRFPVVYFVRPEYASDPDTKGTTDITLSYTFYPVKKTAANAAQPLGGTADTRL